MNPSGYFSDATLQRLFRQKLTEPTRRHLATSHDAIWVLTVHLPFDGGANYCWAAVGLTETPPKDRSARIPAAIFSDAFHADARGKLDSEQLNGCLTEALRDAASDFASASLDQQLQDLERTREKGSRKAETSSETTAEVYARGLSESGRDAVFDAVPLDFRATFDYRRLQWVVFTAAARFGRQVICFSIAGVAARSPDNRTPRFPGYLYRNAREFTLDDARPDAAAQTCRDEMAVKSVKAALSDSWNEKGLLDNFAMVTETGVTPVSSLDVSAEARRLAQFRKSLKVGSESHCGLVVETRGPITRVQSTIGEIWLKTEQIYPKKRHDCHFVNGVYQE